MLDLGDPITLTLTVKVGGVLTDAAPVVLALKPPSGVVTTPTVTHAGTGTYTATVLPDAVGVWREKWTTGAAGQGVVNRSFTVLDPFTGLGGIVSLDLVKDHLNIAATDTTNDDELSNIFIPSAEAQVIGACHQLVPTEFTQIVRTTGCKIILDHFPVLEVSALSEWSGSIPTTVTVIDDPADLAAYVAYLDKPSGILERVDSGGTTSTWASPTTITYTAGYSPMPGDVIEGTLELVRHLYGPQRGPRNTGNRPSSEASLLPAFTLPYFVEGLLKQYLRSPSIG